MLIQMQKLQKNCIDTFSFILLLIPGFALSVLWFVALKLAKY